MLLAACRRVPEGPNDWVAQVFTCTQRIIARQRGQVIAHKEVQARQRYYRPQELRALIDCAGCFTQTYFYGRLALPDLPLTGAPKCEDMAVVLVK